MYFQSETNQTAAFNNCSPAMMLQVEMLTAVFVQCFQHPAEKQKAVKEDRKVIGIQDLSIITFHSKHLEVINPTAAQSFSCGYINWVYFGEDSSFQIYTEIERKF